MNLIKAKPFAPSCEQNQQVILEAIKPYLSQVNSVLEIASGTGQHAVFLAKHLAHLSWQTSDLEPSHQGINQWLAESALNNIKPPLTLDVSQNTWPKCQYQAVFSANSLHIMSHKNVEDFFAKVPKVLEPKAYVLVYGPFNYEGRYTSKSNENFDKWLKQQNSLSCIKDFEWCNNLALKSHLKLVEDIEMPANNRILVWQLSK